MLAHVKEETSEDGAVPAGIRKGAQRGELSVGEVQGLPEGFAIHRKGILQARREHEHRSAAEGHPLAPIVLPEGPHGCLSPCEKDLTGHGDASGKEGTVAQATISSLNKETAQHIYMLWSQGVT
jgi:hypothetical protein